MTLLEIAEKTIYTPFQEEAIKTLKFQGVIEGHYV
jgi:hypothetical protein